MDLDNEMHSNYLAISPALNAYQAYKHDYIAQIQINYLVNNLNVVSLFESISIEPFDDLNQILLRIGRQIFVPRQFPRTPSHASNQFILNRLILPEISTVTAVIYSPISKGVPVQIELPSVLLSALSYSYRLSGLKDRLDCQLTSSWLKYLEL